MNMPSGGSYYRQVADALAAKQAQQQQPIDIGDIDSPPSTFAGGVDSPDFLGPQKPAAPQPMVPVEPQPQLRMVSGGGVAKLPAREVLAYGPSQWTGLSAANDAASGAIQQVSQNSGQQAAAEQDMYAAQARQARLREEAALRVGAERDQEMRARALDFERSAKEMSQQRIDPDRFWASRSTPQKIAAFISVALGGFVQGVRGGSNPGLEIINQQIERDIKAQEFAYHSKRDSASAQQTAFANAMQRYQSVDAARSLARVAAMDAVAAEIARQQAQGRGVEAKNRGILALAEVKQNMAEQLLRGIQFIPERQVTAEPRFRVPGRLGSYTAREVDSMLDKEAGRGFELQKLGVEAGYDVEKERVKGQTQQGGKLNEETQYIAKELKSAGVPQMRQLTEAAMSALTASEGGKAEAASRVILSALTPAGEALPNAVLSEKANAREQAFQAFANLNMNQLSGGAISPAEEVRLKAQLGSAASPEARRRALQSVLDKLEVMERSIKAGASEQAQETFDRRRQNAVGAPPAAPAGATKAAW
jgi:hypothetical protein